MNEEDFYNLLGQPGIFKRSLHNDWSLEFDTLKKVIKSGNLYLYVSASDQTYDNFIPMSEVNKGKNNKVVLKENVSDKDVSDDEFTNLCKQALSVGNNDNYKPVVTWTKNNIKDFIETKMPKFCGPSIKSPSDVNHKYFKYLNKFGIVYNEKDIKRDSNKNIIGVSGHGLRFVKLAGIVEKNGESKFVVRAKSGDFIVKSFYDHFRPFTKEELENQKLGIGVNNCLERITTPRLSTLRYRSDNRNRLIMYKCASSFDERLYDNFYSIKDLSKYLPIAVEE